MPIFVIAPLKPKNNGKFPIADAEDVAMPDGKRLSELDLSVPTKDELVQAVLDALPAAEGVSF